MRTSCRARGFPPLSCLENRVSAFGGWTSLASAALLPGHPGSRRQGLSTVQGPALESPAGNAGRLCCCSPAARAPFSLCSAQAPPRPRMRSHVPFSAHAPPVGACTVTCLSLCSAHVPPVTHAQSPAIAARLSAIRPLCCDWGWGACALASSPAPPPQVPARLRSGVHSPSRVSPRFRRLRGLPAQLANK